MSTRSWVCKLCCPQDPFILLSFVNTQLRDRFDSLEALCEEHQCAPEELRKKLEAVGVRYDKAHNQFK